MEETKQKEIKTFNRIMLGMAGLCFLAAVFTLISDGLSGGTDDIFLILTALLLALLFAVPPLMTAKSQGKLTNPFALGEDVDIHVHDEAAEHAHGGSNKENVIVWGGLLFLTAIEIFLAYIHIQPLLMLVVLMLLSIVKAALIVAYFMHLKFERLSLILTIVPTLIVLFCLFAIFFPDGNRLRHLRGQEPPAQTEPGHGMESEAGAEK
jgi:caa(3)-type oxidase subunit IV